MMSSLPGRYNASRGLHLYLTKADQIRPEVVRRILHIERRAEPVFDEAWRMADEFYEMQSPWCPLWHFMEKECCLAVICYTLQTPNISQRFDAACRSARPTEQSWVAFPYKSFWCLLIRAFRQIPAGIGFPRTFYRGVDSCCGSDLAPLPFAHFVSASVFAEQASKFGRQRYLLSFHCVPPDFVRDISPFSMFPHHAEVLIWPLCRFVCMSDPGAYSQCCDFYDAVPVWAIAPAPLMVYWDYEATPWRSAAWGPFAAQMAGLPLHFLATTGVHTAVAAPDAELPALANLSRDDDHVEIEDTYVARSAQHVQGQAARFAEFGGH